MLFASCGSEKTNSNEPIAKVVSNTEHNHSHADDIPEELPSNVQSPKGLDTEVTKEYLMGKFEPSKDKRFILSSKSVSSEPMYIRKETYDAFLKMHSAAQKDGISLKLISATRNFDRQKQIWEAKWNGQKAVSGKMLTKEETSKDPAGSARRIMEWSSMPGTSRHHWGTDVDLNSLEPAHWLKGTGAKTYAWMQANASKFGFCQVYCEKGSKRPDGYNEEKWHWSYLPLSVPFTKAYKKLVKNEDIKGFSGCESAPLIKSVEHYVLGIAPECMEEH